MGDESQDSFMGRLESVLDDEIRSLLPIGAEDVGGVMRRIIDRIYSEFGGEQPYFPMRPPGSQEQLCKSIIDECDGTNYRRLAAKYRMTERRVRKIVSDHQNSMREP